MNENLIRAQKIIAACRAETSTAPYEILTHIAQNDFVRIHGPEHHILDGAAVLTAFHNAGGKLNLDEALVKLAEQGLRMPGAACGLWGVCGAVSSIGAALAILDGTGPLTDDGTWGSHMRYTSQALGSLADIGGPRCCKRDARVAMRTAIPYIKEHYDVELTLTNTPCTFFPENQQCIGERCPFYPKKEQK